MEVLREHFELTKFKFDDGNQVISYFLHKENENGSYKEHYKEVTIPIKPHEDLEQAVENLKQILVDANCLNSHRNLPKMVGPAIKAVETLETVFKSMDKAVLDSVEVSGLTLQGIPMEGDITEGSCVITGKHKVHNTAVAMNSPKINFSGDIYKFESKLAIIVDTIIDEVYQYLFEGKHAELELFNSDEEAA